MLRTCIFLICAFLISIPGTTAGQLPDLPKIGKDEVRVFLVRHGQSFGNVPAAEIPAGQARDALTERGQEQAVDLARLLAGQPVAALISSETQRTAATLAPLAQQSGLPVSQSSAFNKMKLGQKPDGEPASWNWRVQQWQQDTDPRSLDGESLYDVGCRAFRAIQALENLAGQAVVISSHGDVIAAMCGSADNAPSWDRWPQYECVTGSVQVIDIELGGPATLRAFNIEPNE